MAKIPDNSIDIIFSNAVLEHIEPDQIALMMSESYRVLKRGCSAKHRVDLRDHINDEFKHLRFSAKMWESKFMRNGGTNLNRLEMSEYVRLGEAAGLTCQVVANGNFISATRMRIHSSLDKWNKSKGSYPGFDLNCFKR